MAESFRVEGLRDLERAFIELRESGDLSRATVKNNFKRALIDAAEPMESSAEALAPKLTGALKKSFTTGTRLSRRQKSLHQKTAELEIFVGPGALPQATAQEFGTSKNAAQPFMRPAFDSTVTRVIGRIATSLKKEFDKTVKRLERKAAREAAKLKAGAG